LFLFDWISIEGSKYYFPDQGYTLERSKLHQQKAEVNFYFKCKWVVVYAQVDQYKRGEIDKSDLRGRISGPACRILSSSLDSSQNTPLL
jgi:hypothetical protein